MNERLSFAAVNSHRFPFMAAPTPYWSIHETSYSVADSLEYSWASVMRPRDFRSTIATS
jgi:hypothetical protein